MDGHAVRTRVAGRGLAWLACGVGALYAAVSVYWGVGGTWLLDTVGGSLARLGHDRSPGVLAALWGAVVLKLIAAVAPVFVHASRNADWRALDRHAYLWDPWFLVWGLLIAAALLRARAAVSRR
jgi:hypothetical protein